MSDLLALLAEARACRPCEHELPLGPRPVLRAAATARLLVIGQAPGRRVHESGIPWDDASGTRLRDWLALDETVFYDEQRVAIVPMGLCYPGRAKSGDRAPRRECAPRWHVPLRALMPNVRLTLLVGSYAQAYYLGSGRSLHERVRAYAEAPAGVFPMPHPSWRVQGWMQRNPWFAFEVLPVLREKVRAALDG